jgi:hypothetical protein
MFQKTVLQVTFVTLVLVSTHDASGQDQPQTLIGVSGAFQAANTAFRDNVTFILNEEDGDLNADYQVGIGRSWDAGLELRVWHGLMAGVNVSYFEKQGRVNVDARLPHPFFFNRHRGLVGEADFRYMLARDADVGADVLAFAGADVQREYYVDDSGTQADALGRSVAVRYRELVGDTSVSFPEDGVRGRLRRRLREARPRRGRRTV